MNTKSKTTPNTNNLKRQGTPLVSLSLGVLSTLLFFFPNLIQYFEWQRDLVLKGHLWCIWTSHFTHFSFTHYFWDTMVFIILGSYLESFSRKTLIQFIIISGITLSLYNFLFLDPSTVYRGLSGIDSGLFSLIIMSLFLRTKNRSNRIVYSFIMALFFLKIIYEVNTGNCFFVKDSINFIPAYGAHLVGFLAGLVVSFVFKKD